MKHLTFISLLFLSFNGSSQEVETTTIESTLIDEFSLNADSFIGVDDFNSIYYLKGNTLYKKTNKQTYSYTNTQLGEIESVDIRNPLKILLFYGNFNTVLFLDNRLNELTKPINFTNETIFKTISLTTISSNDNLWLFSLDDNTLQLWNHQTKKTQLITQPISSYNTNFEVKQLISSYKNCWLIGENKMLKFNEYGTFLNEHKINSFTDIKILEDDFIYLNNNQLYLYNDKKKLISFIIDDKIVIKSFYVNKNRIYIFDGSTIFTLAFIKI